VKSIMWDHTAVGGSVNLEHPRLEIGIGAGGIKRFSLLIQLARDNPPMLVRALAPMLGRSETVSSTIG
jgi:hypothetical protein